MKFSKAVATSALLIAAVGVSAGTAYADPTPVMPSLIGGIDQGANQALPGIGWKTRIEGDSVIVDTDSGSLTTDNGQLQVRDAQGAVVVGLPLAYSLNDLEYPIDAAVDGLRATLTPRKDVASAHHVDLVRPVASVETFDAAVGAAATQLGLVTSIGTMLGTVVGGALGCAIGGIGGLILGIPVLDVGGATGVAGCLGGAAVGIALGAAAGLVVTGVPAMIAIGIGFMDRINAPEGE
ncbi:hypothetical protein GFY24_26490 [Nocardia sp. SYP-A9097]|uniref:hypothetical protein n=1 Tax=Nocardia sp. SYP-A9097 TaxID=2663237 RepID=UPI00129B0418|nr:hypothetical protein [Nocardia sp. SYP-A9097]MRH90946.1 hypothetical protein [Nocardia sp. SYP-A9097]